MGRNLQREYGQESQVTVVTPLLVGTDGVHKMSKSLGNYIGIDEPPSEIFGKVMSISDELMWSYYELLTDAGDAEIKRMQAAAGSGASNPRDLKVELATRLVADFHSATEARAAAEEFRRIFQRKEAPDEVEESAVAAQTWKLPRLLVETKLAPSMAEARRLIEQGGVRIDGERHTQPDAEIALDQNRSALIQVGKRRFLRVRGK
jgi:tyrosyl-tRNA synthetase